MCDAWKVLSFFFQKCLNSYVTADNSASRKKNLNKLVLIFLPKCCNKAAHPLNLPRASSIIHIDEDVSVEIIYCEKFPVL